MISTSTSGRVRQRRYSTGLLVRARGDAVHRELFVADGEQLVPGRAEQGVLELGSTVAAHGWRAHVQPAQEGFVGYGRRYLAAAERAEAST